MHNDNSIEAFNNGNYTAGLTRDSPEVHPAIGLRRDRHVEPPPGMRGIASKRNLSSLLQGPNALDEKDKRENWMGQPIEDDF